MATPVDFEDVHAIASAEVGTEASINLAALQRDPVHLAEAEREFARRFLSSTITSFALLVLAQLMFAAGGPAWLRISAMAIATLLVVLRLWLISLVRQSLRTRRFRMTLAAIGGILMPGIWGVVYAGHLAFHGAQASSMALAVMVCGIATGIITAMGATPRIQQAAMLALLIPLPLVTLFHNTQEMRAWALMNVMYFLYTSVQARATARDYWRALGTSDLLARHAASLRAAHTERKQMEENLRFAERMASLGTLAAGIAHEINNPMTYVLGNLEYACEVLTKHSSVTPLPVLADEATLRELLEEAQDGARRVARIVRDLKAFSRHTDDDPLAPVALEEALDTAAEMAMAQIRHRAKLERRYRGDTLVMGNTVRLGQVFLNLVINAAQAIPEGGSPATDQIILRTYCDAQGRAVAEVEDTGVGIDPAVRGKIFDPFFTTKPVGVGTGLGLSSAMGIVSAFGGTIEVENGHRRGTVVRVVLPRAAVSPIARGVARPALANAR